MPRTLNWVVPPNCGAGVAYGRIRPGQTARGVRRRRDKHGQASSPKYRWNVDASNATACPAPAIDPCVVTRGQYLQGPRQ
jgi:hypothetical protein